ncbi:MAG: hypothetical protein OEV40_28620, partial [Acidimicrobiia bacterium]|nr:hypothetical protein [Acidimicrobiia bacterium]
FHTLADWRPPWIALGGDSGRVTREHAEAAVMVATNNLAARPQEHDTLDRSSSEGERVNSKITLEGS